MHNKVRFLLQLHSHGFVCYIDHTGMCLKNWIVVVVQHERKKRKKTRFFLINLTKSIFIFKSGFSLVQSLDLLQIDTASQPKSSPAADQDNHDSADRICQNMFLAG